ncbi:FMN-binding negative transcriptional regulator [Mesorhizobium sp. M0118]
MPTWNYLVVHAHGRITVRDDERYVRRNVAKLTHMHEASQPAPWKMGDAPKDFIDTMVKAIVALEIEITGLVGQIPIATILSRQAAGAGFPTGDLERQMLRLAGNATSI